MTPAGVAQLKRDEGLRLRAYPDPLTGGEPWTIGYGHTGRDVRKGLTITRAQADDLLVGDVAHAEALCGRFLPWGRSLTPARQDVLANMIFNMGWDDPRTPALEGLSGFVNTLAAIKAGRYQAAADGMLASLWARQVGARAKRLAKIMRLGE